MDKYFEWLKNTSDYPYLHDELAAIDNDEAEIEDRFYRDLAFGTGGLRGLIGAGTNRMNIFTVGRATSGLADYILENNIKKSVVIAYDSRNMSREFAERTADVLSSKGIASCLFDNITSTPVLSYAVRFLGAGAGIVITASHNPKEYNGYKVYNANGCQITDKAAGEILKKINSKSYFEEIRADKSIIEMIGDEILDNYLDEIINLSLFNEVSDYAPKIVYTPLHGTGNIPVRKILAMQGITEIEIVKEQEMPDGEFTTCPYPNPEEKSALSLALQYARKSEAELILATDPDADRIGIAVRDNDGDFMLLNGNETGILLVDYMLARKRELGTLGKNPTVIKTIVSTDMIFDIATEYGADVIEVLTGFKYIGEKMDEIDNFVVGMEESYGYLVGKHARDKDAVSAVMMITEMLAYYKKQGRTLYSVLCDLYKKHGYYLTDLTSKTYAGSSGAKTMRAIIDKIRDNPTLRFFDESLKFTDFAVGVDGLPKSDVLRFKGRTVRALIRPSGTEPKLKIYYQIKAKSFEDARIELAYFKSQIESLLS